MKKIILAILLTLTAVQIAHPAQLVVNGGFETGDFTGWTVAPASTGSLILVYGDGWHSDHAAWFGATGEEVDTISQNLLTVAGHKYDIEFYLQHRDDPGNFLFSWDGKKILYLVNPAPFPYVKYKFHLDATSPLTAISFSGFETWGWFLLDRVTVNGPRGPVVPLPSSLLLVGSCLLLVGFRKAKGENHD